jgi:hypothetical protein
MSNTCPEYERLLRRYQLTLRVWGERKAEMGDRTDAALEELEERHRCLVAHQQSCRICSSQLGQSAPESNRS